MKTYLRGDIYYAYFGNNMGSEQSGFRPVLIVQNNIGNKYSKTVIVAAITSKVGQKTKMPTHYYLAPDVTGLTRPSYVLMEQLRTIDKKRLSDYIGRVNEKQMCKIDHALAISLGLVDSFSDKLIMCLCETCLQSFIDAEYNIYRVDIWQKSKNTCDYCNYRRGYDYAISRR